MTNNTTKTELLVADLFAALSQAKDAAEQVQETAGMRERFQELVVLALANLYGKTPIATTLYDRTLLKRVTEGMDDNDAGKLSLRAEDWLRLEGVVRGQEGQKAYYLSSKSLAVLSEKTPQGTLGEVLEQIQSCYTTTAPQQALRKITREFGAHVLQQLAAA
jgi:hypothetical protein